MAEQGLEDWPQAEVIELYKEAYPLDRRSARRSKLRQRQIDLLHQLEGLAAETPSPGDLVSGWFDDATAKKLLSAGMVNLGDLNARVSAGGRWYSGMPAIGETKANRIAAQLLTLLPLEAQPRRTQFELTTTHGLLSNGSTALQ